MSGPEFRLLNYSVTLTAQEYALIKRAGQVERVVDARACHALADALSRDAAISREVIEPDPDDPWGGTRVTVLFSVGVMVKAAEVRAFERQLEQARVEGMGIAADLCKRRANAFNALREPGPCRHVLVSELEGAAVAIRKAAAQRLKTYEKGIDDDQDSRPPRPPRSDG